MRNVLTIIGGLLLLAVGFFVAKSLAGNEKPARKQPPKVIQRVFTQQVNNADIPIVVYESGILMAKNRIELFAEVQGVMESASKEFKPGTSYNRGEAIVRIRNTDYGASLQAQKSTLQNMITAVLPDLRLDFSNAYEKWDKYVREFDINKPVTPLPEPTSEKEKFFITGKNIFTTYYATKNMEVVYSKYTLRAPFHGILTESLITPGSLIRQGQKLGEFIDPSVYELEVSVGKSIYPYLSVGKQVVVKESNNADREWQGKILRINGRVDQTTQTVQVFIALKGKELKEGMYLEAMIEGKEEQNAFELNRGLLINENALYVIRESRLELQPVVPVYFTNNTVIVRGLKDGDQVVSKPIAGAYSGMEVEVITE